LSRIKSHLKPSAGGLEKLTTVEYANRGHGGTVDFLSISMKPKDITVKVAIMVARYVEARSKLAELHLFFDPVACSWLSIAQARSDWTLRAPPPSLTL
jgi:hypothetical protein